jgi:hypothetical protein
MGEFLANLGDGTSPGVPEGGELDVVAAAEARAVLDGSYAKY